MSDHVAPPSRAARTAWCRATRAASNVVEAPPTTSRRRDLSGDVTVSVVVGFGRAMALRRRRASTRPRLAVGVSEARAVRLSPILKLAHTPELVKPIT